MVNELEESLAQDAREEEDDPSLFPDYRLPEDFATRERRIKRLKKANDALIEEQNEHAKQKEQQITERDAEERESGKKKRGQKPNPPNYEPSRDAKVNLTDPESRIMKTQNGHLQGYNIQFVTNCDQFIISANLTNAQNDKEQLEPNVADEMDVIRECEETPPSVLVADAGYYSTSNILSERRDSPSLIIATKKERNFDLSAPNIRLLSEIDDLCRPRSDLFPAIPVITSLARAAWELFLNRDSPAKQQEIVRCVMDARMTIPSNREHYRKRKWMVESANGNLKSNLRFTRFQGKGIKFCAGELALAALCMNILKARNLKVLPDVLECQKHHGGVKGQRGVSGLSLSKGIVHQAKGVKGLWDYMIRWIFHNSHMTERRGGVIA